ncbi:MAG: hypothetical protein Q8P93_04275 [bacterium]|nr:hypothetical protein [bacterium]
MAKKTQPTKPLTEESLNMPQEQEHHPVVVVLAIVILGALGVYFYNSMQTTDDVSHTYTIEERRAILESLRSDESKYTREERQEILESLRAQEGEGQQYTKEERRLILESLRSN